MRRRLATARGEAVAAVDLGSNSFHMLVARENAGQLQIIDRLREAVRLAAGLDQRDPALALAVLMLPRLRALEDENRRLKHIVADLTLDNQALKAINSKNW